MSEKHIVIVGVASVGKSTMGRGAGKRLGFAPARVLLATVCLLATMACRGRQADIPSEIQSAAQTGQPQAQREPGPAQQALVAMLRLPRDAPASEKTAVLAAGFLKHTETLALRARNTLAIRAGYGSMTSEKRKHFLQVMCQGTLHVDDYVPFQEFNDKVNERSLHEFGKSWKEIRDMNPAVLRDIWIAGGNNWLGGVLFNLRDSHPTGERELGDRCFVTCKGRRGEAEVLMLKEQGTWRYAGTWADRKDYLVGPERESLFEGLTGKDRQEAAGDDLSELQSALILFRQKHGRYPTVEEGMNALIENPGGPEEARWDGPYAHHVFDPWGRPWRFLAPGTHNPEFFDLWSPGPDGKEETPDDVRNW